MNALTTVAAGQPATMSSREIAELTGKRHDHVLRDVRVLQEQLGGMFGGSPQTWVHPLNRQTYEEFVLDKDTCLTLLLGYDPVARMKVVKRWQELEAAQAPAKLSRMEILQIALESEQARIKAEEALALAAPKAKFAEAYMEADSGSMTFRQVCKLLKVKEPVFRAFLLERKFVYYLSGAMTAYAHHIEAGRFEVKAGVAGNEHAYTSTRFTPKGVEWVAGEWGKHSARTMALSTEN